MTYDIDELLKRTATINASDLHVTAGSVPIYRVNGKLQPYGDERLLPDDTAKMARHLLNDKSWRHLQEHGEVDASYSVPSVARFRLNVFRQRHAVGIAARMIPSNIPSIEQLNMPDVLRKLAMKPQGLILVTGPTGSGKSTSLASMINHINERESKHIITLEDPIEYMHKHKKSIIHQREIGVDTESFSNALRAALRQDPDIVLVGEMRDLETIGTAITAAETGHLVLATLHTNSAAETINRIIDVFPPHQQLQIRIQLASVLEGIISQRLFPTSDGTGRVAATEILIQQPSIANLIRGEKVEQIKNIMQMSRSAGMHTLQMSINDLLASGQVTHDVVAPYLDNEGEF